MNKSSLSYLSLLFLITLTMTSCFQKKEPLSEKDLAIKSVLIPTARLLARRHEMRCVGYSYAAFKEIKSLGFNFHVSRSLITDEARKLAVDCVRELTKAVQANEAIQPYLLDTGFSYENVEISFFVDPGHKTCFFPEIGLVCFRKGKIKYSAYDYEFYKQEKLYKSSVMISESYLEAFEKIKNSL